MSGVVDAFSSFAARWHEGLMKLGLQLLQVHGRPAPPARTLADGEADREALEQERARLALLPWWI